MAVQSFVSTVAFGTLLQPIVVLALIVFGCLALAGMLRALQTVVVERLQERVFARAVLEMAHKLPHVELSALRGGEHPDPVNRFFDVLVIQKSLASLLLDGIAIVLSTVVGMMLLAFYHPFLLAFDVVLLALIALVVLGLGRGGVRTSIYESKAKHAVASYLEDVVRNPMAFRLYPAMAAEKADDLARAYLVARRAHFRVVLRQSVGALALQALASAGLLAVGGWLVLERRLTLGQLVAAELVVGSVVAGVSKLGKHIETYYDLVASIDKLGHVLDLPLEHQGGALVPDSGGGCAVVAEGPVVERLTGARTLRLAPGQVTILPRREGDDAHSFGDACWGAEGDSIQVTLDGVHARDVPRDELRRVVAVVSEANAFAGSVFDNVALARPWVGTAEVLSALRRSGLDRVVHELPQAADTELATGGAPLTSSQVTMLSVARALAGRPRLLVLDGVLDSLPDDAVAAVLSSLGSAARETTAVVLTNRKDLRSFAPGA